MPKGVKSVKRPQLSLRDLFWLVLVVAIAAGWTMAHIQGARQLEELKNHWPFFGYRSPSAPSKELQARMAALETLSKLSDAQVSEQFGTLNFASLFHNEPEYEPCLAEMARRGMQKELQQHY